MFSKEAPYNAIDDTNLVDCETQTVICNKNGNQNIREHSVQSFSVHASDFDQDEEEDEMSIQNELLEMESPQRTGNSARNLDI